MSADFLAPIEVSAKISDIVIQRIVSGIIEGSLRPGDTLPSESQLSKQMKVGLSSVREALATLEGLGVLTSRHGSGRTVKGFTLAALTDPRIRPMLVDEAMMLNVWEARLPMEIAIVRAAAERAKPTDLAEARAAARAMDEAIEQGGFGRECDAQFHRAVAGGTGNAVFVWMDDALGYITREVRKTGMDREEFARIANAEHWELIAAIEAGDADKAEEITRRHVQRGYDDARTAYRDKSK